MTDTTPPPWLSNVKVLSLLYTWPLFSLPGPYRLPFLCCHRLLEIPFDSRYLLLVFIYIDFFFKFLFLFFPLYLVCYFLLKYFYVLFHFCLFLLLLTKFFTFFLLFLLGPLLPIYIISSFMFLLMFSPCGMMGQLHSALLSPTLFLQKEEGILTNSLKSSLDNFTWLFSSNGTPTPKCWDGAH